MSTSRAPGLEKERFPIRAATTCMGRVLSKRSQRFFTVIFRASVNRGRGGLSPIAFERRNEFAPSRARKGESVVFERDARSQVLEIIAA
jgi:hypothetical protein